MKKKFEQHVIDEIIRQYREGKSITRLNKEFHTTKVRDILIANNIPVPEKGKAIGGAKRLYSLDETYFENIDSKDKAYFLGFIYADGFITKRSSGQNVLGITLSESEPLDKFKKYIKTDKPYGIYNKTSSYSDKSIEYKLAIISNKIVEDIEKLGVVERKTLILSFPDFLDKELIPHFIRGYFDGDGSIFLTKPKNRDSDYLGINICGTKEFLIGLRKHLDFLGDSECIYKELRNTTNCWNIKLLSNLRSLGLYHYLYKDCDDLYLSRKREIFENFIKEEGSETIITNPTNKEYLKLCYLED